MSADDESSEGIAVRFPANLPILNREASRILLTMLVELTEIEVLDGPPERESE